MRRNISSIKNRATFWVICDGTTDTSMQCGSKIAGDLRRKMLSEAACGIFLAYVTQPYGEASNMWGDINEFKN